MDRISRKNLKSDKFAEEVSHTVEFFEAHRKQSIRYGAIALAVILAAAGWHFYSKRQRAARQSELLATMRILEAAVGQPSPGVSQVFATEEEKRKAVTNALNDFINRHSGTDEGAIARYYLGTEAADQGNLAEAEKAFKQVIDTADANYASLARYSLAQIYRAQGKGADAEKLLRPLLDKPTALVSKEQATIALARALAPARPEEARKLLEPLRTQTGSAGRSALAALGEIPAKPGK